MDWLAEASTSRWKLSGETHTRELIFWLSYTLEACVSSWGVSVSSLCDPRWWMRTGFLGKIFSHRDHVYSFPPVCLLVGTDAGAVVEAFPTVHTGVGPLLGVDSPVSAELGAAVESLPKDSALIRLLPGVGPLVDNEAGALVEAFPTLPTVVESLPRVHPYVGSEVGMLTEAIPTFTALVRLLSCVDDAE